MFFLLLGLNVSFLLSGIIALCSGEFKYGAILLGMGILGFGFMVWYYQRKKKNSKHSWNDVPDCLLECAPTPDCECIR
ncbi:hypothetical protein [Baia soyae]|uniref:Uncharacterized protein n=1 Tax=Baia soyae TaxID=1544746 RepID=A0A4R2S1H1_9BACL|nr:hypothetical protein [Baia soyae]TCP69047.1 hypothetical protein EDD57_11430 [Baia soyae]